MAGRRRAGSGTQKAAAWTYIGRMEGGLPDLVPLGGPDTRQSTAAATRYTRVDNNDYLGENPGGTLGAAGLLVDPSLPGVVSCQALPHHRGGEASHEGFLSTKQAC